MKNKFCLRWDSNTRPPAFAANVLKLNKTKPNRAKCTVIELYLNWPQLPENQNEVEFLRNCTILLYFPMYLATLKDFHEELAGMTELAQENHGIFIKIMEFPLLSMAKYCTYESHTCFCTVFFAEVVTVVV